MEVSQGGVKVIAAAKKILAPARTISPTTVDEDEAEAQDIASLHIHGEYRVVNPPIKKSTLSADFFCVPPSNCRLGGFGVAQATASFPPFRLLRWLDRSTAQSTSSTYPSQVQFCVRIREAN